MDNLEPNKTMPEQSPPWSNTTKLVVGLTFVAIIAGLLISFRNFIIPILLSFMVAYLLYPLADRLRKILKIPWRLLVTMIYLIVILVVIGLITWGGFALVDQIVSLVKFLQKTITNLPEIIDQISKFEFTYGPIQVNFDQLDLVTIGNQILSVVQPMLSRVGVVITSLASGTFVTIGWGLFVIIISYFILVETEGISGNFINVDLPGYRYDLVRMGKELGRIWNAFLRGQLIVMGLTIVIYSILLSVLGVRFSVGLSTLAALSRLIPYVGPALAWATYGLVAYFQGSNIFNLQPFVYVLIVVGVSWLTDAIIDNFISPRILGDALHVHPAAVMVAALVAASLFGVVGVILAAPVLATVMLIGNYAIRKSFDQNPWDYLPAARQPPAQAKSLKKIHRLLIRGGAEVMTLVNKFTKRIKNEKQ